MQFTSEDLLNENVITAVVTVLVLAGLLVWIFAVSKRKAISKK